MSSNEIGRREWFKRTALAGAGAGFAGAAYGAKTPDAIRVAQSVDKVPRKQLGTTGREIPILVMGCGQNFDPVYDKVLHRSFQEGVDYLDTAVPYAAGKSHGQLKPFIEQVGRDNLWITSKASLFKDEATPENYLSELERIPSAMGIEKLDMFFMHDVRTLSQLDPEYIKMADEAKRRGLTDFFGFSCHMRNVVELMNKAASIGAPGIDAIMFRYNFATYGDIELNKAIDACKEAGIGLIAMKTQGSVPEDSEAVRAFQANEYTLPQAKLKAVWADERIDAAVSEMTNVQQVKENADAAKAPAQLSMREFQQLNRYAARTASNRCLGCNEICEARVDGDLRIADTLRYLMYAECYGEYKEPHAREMYGALTRAERDFANVDLAEATRACPQGIDIAKRLRDAKTRLA